MESYPADFAQRAEKIAAKAAEIREAERKLKEQRKAAEDVVLGRDSMQKAIWEAAESGKLSVETHVRGVRSELGCQQIAEELEAHFQNVQHKWYYFWDAEGRFPVGNMCKISLDLKRKL